MVRIDTSVAAGALMLTALACGATPNKETRASGPATAKHASEVVKRAQLRSESHGGKPFPYPLVDVTIAGKPMAMIVGTGADVHVIASSLVKRLGLSLSVREDHSATDHGGKKSRTWGVSVPGFAVDGLGEVRDSLIIALDLPPIFDTLQIAGILSPQQLANAGESVVLDFPAATLEVLATPSASERIGQRPQLRPVTISTCRKEHGLRSYAVQANVNDTPVTLLIDTGADSSDIKLDSELGRKLQASGPTATGTLSAAEIQLGERTRTADITLVPGRPEPCNEGVIGMDMLERCVLVLGDTAAAACEP